MGIIEKLFPATVKRVVEKTIKATPIVLMGNTNPTQYYAWVGGFPVYNQGDTIQNVDNGYVGSDDVYSIVRRIARTAAMIPLKVYRVKDEAALKRYEFERDLA